MKNNTNIQEIWKPVIGFPHYYVSNLGRIYSAKTNRILAQKNHRDGYLAIRFALDGKNYMENVHRVVAKAFIPNPENKPQVNHINGNKKDNRVSNLEWMTAKENVQHALNTGLRSKSKLSLDDQKEIVKLYKEGKTNAELGKMFHVGKTTIQRYTKGIRPCPRLTQETLDLMKLLCEQNKYSAEEIAEICNVERSTVFRHKKEWGLTVAK